MSSISLSKVNSNNYLAQHQSPATSPAVLYQPQKTASDSPLNMSVEGMPCGCSQNNDLQSILAEMVNSFRELVELVVRTIRSMKGHDNISSSEELPRLKTEVQDSTENVGGWSSKFSDLITTGKKIYDGAKSVWDFFTGKDSGDKLGGLFSGAANFVSSLF